MQPKPADNQNLLFTARLEQILDHNHSLFKLAHVIDWSEFEESFGKLYDPGPAIDSSLMTRWRQKVKAEGMEKLLEVTIKTGLKIGALKRA